MIRRDYIIRMIEEFVEALRRIQSLKNGELWDEATAGIDEQIRKLVAGDLRTVAELSETELLARLVQGEVTLAVRDKTLMLATLMHEAGEAEAAQGRLEASRVFELRGLHLLLNAMARGEMEECPSYVPKVEVFVEALQQEPLPVRTEVLLMEHYECTGQFGRAEDALYRILESQPGNDEARQFGVSFYERLLGQSDAALEEGNLPRAEVESGLAALRGAK